MTDTILRDKELSNSAYSHVINAPIEKVDIADWLFKLPEAEYRRCCPDVGLAIADNFASGNLPPFKLVEVVESLGLGPVHPDHASPMEIITGLLADLPPEQTNPTAVARAHVDMLESEFKYQWFEAGEALQDLLYPVKGSKQRIAKLMKAYLPERRLFWARLCAISALAMARHCLGLAA